MKCSAAAWLLLVDDYKSVKTKNENLKVLLRAVKCPECDGSGIVQVVNGYNDVDYRQCQWCDAVGQTLKEMI